MGGPFVPINCGAIPESLIESEIFGFEKGSFTGAVRPKKGLIEVAEGGTLFLDEVGEISLKMQVDLLRVLQDKCFYRVGGLDALKADFRLVSATHKDLTKQIAGKLSASGFLLPHQRDHPPGTSFEGAQS